MEKTGQCFLTAVSGQKDHSVILPLCDSAPNIICRRTNIASLHDELLSRFGETSCCNERKWVIPCLIEHTCSPTLIKYDESGLI